MSGDHPVKVPKEKYAQAREYQIRMKQTHGVVIPLWRCVVQMEQQQKQTDLVMKNLQRRFKL